MNKLASFERTVQNLEAEVNSLKQSQKNDKLQIKTLEEKIEGLEEKASLSEGRIQELKKLHGTDCCFSSELIFRTYLLQRVSEIVAQ